MVASDEAGLASTVGFEIVYHVARYLLEPDWDGCSLPEVLEGLILSELI
jgi:hypothetical protein